MITVLSNVEAISHLLLSLFCYRNRCSVRHKFLTRSLLSARKPVLLTGETGTGKTATLAELLASGMPNQFVPLQLTFSAQTSANQVRGKQAQATTDCYLLVMTTITCVTANAFIALYLLHFRPRT